MTTREAEGAQGAIAADHGPIRFYRASGEWGFLSNLYQRAITFEMFDPRDSVAAVLTFRSVEEAYQYAKPKRVDVAQWLISAPKPHLCAAAAHALLAFDVRPDWQAVKVPWMWNLVTVKFQQHHDLADKLVAGTGDRELIEDSKTDAFWGCGKKGDGKNMLGVLLMAVRAELLAASPTSPSPARPTKETSDLAGGA